MGYRQPRVPEYRDGESLTACMRQMILFLKDCTMAAWAANGRRIKEIRALEARVKALEKEEEKEGGIE